VGVCARAGPSSLLSDIALALGVRVGLEEAATAIEASGFKSVSAEYFCHRMDLLQQQSLIDIVHDLDAVVAIRAKAAEVSSGWLCFFCVTV
jgi:hypothetical protein